MKAKTLLCLFLASFIFNVAAQNYIHVPGDYPTIQEGINATINGDTVLVDQGVYEENISLLGRSICVMSNYFLTLDSADIFNTVIDGSNPADTNKASVVTMPPGSDTNSVICGFTIRGGNGTLFTNRIGGGILCFNGGKIIHNRIIDNNVFADEHALGSGIFLEGISSSYFIIKKNLIENNHLENTNSSFMSWGTIGIYKGIIIVDSNIIRYNTANGRPYGVGMYLNNVKGFVSHNIISYDTGFHVLAGKSRGGGMYVVNSQAGLEITNNEITNNHLIWDTGGGNFSYGGGIAVLNTGGYEYNAILIDNNTIKNNFAKLGGGISVTEVFNIRISNNMIKDNDSEQEGGGIFIQAYNKGNESHSLNNNSHNEHPMPEKNSLERPLFVNNTIINNNADNGGGIASLMDAEKFIAFNNIIYENTAASGSEVLLGGNCSGYFHNNNIDTNDIEGAGNWSGDDNIFCNPEFEDEDGHLLWFSQCIGMGLDSIKIEGEVYHCPDHDFDGDPRPQGILVDIGADETPLWVGIEVKNTDVTGVELYPNPVSSNTNIHYTLYSIQYTNLTLYDAFGRIVEVLVDETQKPGEYVVTWNAEGLPSGIYLYRFTTGDKVATGKVIKR